MSVVPTAVRSTSLRGRNAEIAPLELYTATVGECNYNRSSVAVPACWLTAITGENLGNLADTSVVRVERWISRLPNIDLNTIPN